MFLFMIKLDSESSNMFNVRSKGVNTPLLMSKPSLLQLLWILMPLCFHIQIEGLCGGHTNDRQGQSNQVTLESRRTTTKEQQVARLPTNPQTEQIHHRQWGKTTVREESRCSKIDSKRISVWNRTHKHILYSYCGKKGRGKHLIIKVRKDEACGNTGQWLQTNSH